MTRITHCAVKMKRCWSDGNDSEDEEEEEEDEDQDEDEECVALRVGDDTGEDDTAPSSSAQDDSAPSSSGTGAPRGLNGSPGRPRQSSASLQARSIITAHSMNWSTSCSH